MKKVLFLITGIILLLFSCSNNVFYETMFRTTEDPFYDEPVVDSLSMEHTIYISWVQDEGADEYVLMRSADSVTGLNFSSIYRGKNCNYTDTNLAEDGKYIYRLDKIRGSKYFKGISYGYGFDARARKDNYENNDTEDKATFLEYKRECNIPCVQFFTNSYEYEDVDWFYIEVPPRRTAQISIIQENISTTIQAPTNLCWQIAGREPEPIAQQVDFDISNTEDVTRIIKFKIIPSLDNLFDPNGSYIKFIEYTITYDQFINLRN